MHFPLFTIKKKIVGASAIARDITDKKSKEEKLKEKYEELSAIYEELAAAEEELRSNYIKLENAKIAAENANAADELKLRQVLINLFNNSLKYTEKGHILFKIKKISQVNEKVILEFSIEGTGTGIKDKFKKQIFKKFVYQNTSLENYYSSTGLGLLVSDVAALIDGRTKEIVVKNITENFTKQQRESVLAVSLDMSRTYAAAVLECFPNAAPVTDRFHISQAFHSAVDEASVYIDYFTVLVSESEILELQSFCKTLNNWREYILNYYYFFISNGPTEGRNHKLKNIKRRGYGYRNIDNFRLRICCECA